MFWGMVVVFLLYASNAYAYMMKIALQATVVLNFYNFSDGIEVYFVVS